MTPGKSDRFPYLSALRGIAALWVVMAHVALMPNPRFVLSWWPETLVRSGVMGVNLFFLVSAFSLCLTMPKHDNEQRPYLGFMLRRFFRIAPLFYAVVIFSYWWNPAGLPYNLKTILANLTFIFNFIPGRGYQTSIIFAGWTIGVEMAFYLVFPFIYAKTKSVTLAIRALVIALVVATVFRSVIGDLVADPGIYIRQSIFDLAPMFMFGIIAFHVVQIAGEWTHRRAIGAVLLASVPLQFYVIVTGRVPFGPAIYWQGPMFFCLLVGLYLFPIKPLVNAATRWLGDISYSVYLVHGPIIAALFPLFGRLRHSGLSELQAYALALAISLLCIVPVATLTFHAWENWTNEWGKRFASRRAGKKRVEIDGVKVERPAVPVAA
ncbi:acyltransferase family protein [Mesorhizobium sophorae]|uniref:acyltransferase family protein n=1 Tax=Mesorhizobium sophorae TaxID=1300294 RepID=UPI000BA403BB|nr:acyltransferase [Mesorhizobium sophorae]